MSGDEEAKLYNSGLIEPENEPRDDEDTTHFLRDDDLEELDEAEREFFSGNGLDDGEDKDKPAAEPGEISERSKRDLFAINNYISVALETFLRKNHGQIFSGGWLDRSRLLHGSPEKRIVEYVTEEMPHSSNADFTLKETKLAGSVAREIYEALLKPNDADDRAALDHLATGIRGNLSKVIEDNVHSYFGRMTEEPENRSAAFNALAKELDRNYVSANGEGLKRKNVAGLFAYVPAEDVAEEKVSAEEKKPADEVPEDKKDVSAPENKEDLRAVEAICIMGALKKFMDEHKQSIYEGSWVDRNVFVSKTPVQYLGDFVREEFKGSSDAREFSERELNLITDAVRDLYETRLKPKDADDRQALMDLSQGIGGTLDTVINDNVSRYFLEGHHFPDKMPKPYRRLLDEFQGKKPGRGKRFAAALGGALAIGIVGGVVAANVEHCAGLDCRSASTAADAAPYFAELDADVDAAPAPIVADAEIVHDAEAAEAADADRDSEPETPMVPWEPAGPMTYDDNQLPKLPFGPEPDNFVRFDYDSTEFSDPLQVEAIDDRIIDALEEAEEYNEEHGNTVPVRGVVVNAVCTSSIEGPFDYNMDLSGERAGAFSAHIGNLADQFDYGGMESGAWGIGESDANGPGTGGPAGDGYGRGSDNPNRTCSVTVSIRDDSHDSKAAETEDVEEDSPQPETRDEQDPQTEEMPDVWEIESGPSEGPEEMPVGEDEAPDDGLVRRAEDCLEQIDRVAEPGRQYRSVQLQDCMNAYRSTRRDVSYNAYHGEGASVREIADDLGVSTSTVYRDLKAMATVHGETAPSVHLADCRENRMQFAYEAKEMGSCVREIAESLGVSKSTVYRDLTRAREEIGAVGKAD